MDEQVFLQGMNKLASVPWGNRPANETDGIARLLLYREALAELTDAEFVAAVDRAVMACRWYPVPAELLAFARPSHGSSRDPDLDFDPIALWRRDQDAQRWLGTGPRLLPERVLSAEQAAERAARVAALRQETVARMRQATADHRATPAIRRAQWRLARDQDAPVGPGSEAHPTGA